MKNSKYSKIRETIKNLSQEQTDLKNQRRTVNIQGERFMEPENAVSKILQNRYELRHLFLTYSILKGRLTEPPKNAEFSPSLIEKYINQYKPEEKTEEQIAMDMAYNILHSS